MSAQTITANILRIRERISAAAARAGRTPEEITLIAVTKRVTTERVQTAYEAGIRDFGENYVQEAVGKVKDPLLDLPDLKWHFIGHVQSNKAREIVGRFRLVHSVDSLPLVREIGRRAQQHGGTAPILLEVKLDPAEAKFGFEPDTVLEAAEQAMRVPGIAVKGLMGMAPFGDDPEQARPSFRRLHILFQQLPSEARQTLSMGMTGDFEVAIEEGATHLRIGTAIFGRREP